MQSLRGQKGPSYRPWSSPGLSAGGVASSAAGTQVLAGTGAGPWDASGSSLQATRAGQRSRALPGQPRVAASSRPQPQASGFWRGSRLKADPERAGSRWHALGLALSPTSPLGSQWSAASLRCSARTRPSLSHAGLVVKVPIGTAGAVLAVAAGSSFRSVGPREAGQLWGSWADPRLLLPR